MCQDPHGASGRSKSVLGAGRVRRYVGDSHVDVKKGFCVLVQEVSSRL